MAHNTIMFGRYDTCGCCFNQAADRNLASDPEFVTVGEAQQLQDQLIDTQLAELVAARPDITVKGKDRYSILKGWYGKLISEMETRQRALQDDLFARNITEIEYTVGFILAKSETVRLLHINFEKQPIPTMCPAHAHLGHTKARHDTAKDENVRKNTAIAKAINQIPGLDVDDIDWDYDGTRVLILNIPSGKTTVSQVNALIGLLIALFGAGKVKVNRV